MLAAIAAAPTAALLANKPLVSIVSKAAELCDGIAAVFCNTFGVLSGTVAGLCSGTTGECSDGECEGAFFLPSDGGWKGPVKGSGLEDGRCTRWAATDGGSSWLWRTPSLCNWYAISPTFLPLSFECEWHVGAKSCVALREESCCRDCCVCWCTAN
jgi:hypothetical protein